MRKIIISVAPVEPALDRSLVSPEAVAREVIECTREGASMVHLHVRDEKGKPTDELSTFSKTIGMIRDKSDIVIQGSTGGCSDLTLDQRCVSLNEPFVETATLNMGSTNFGEDVYVNSLSDIRHWASRIYEKDVLPELEIFDGGMLHSSLKLYEEKVLKARLNFALCLGFPSSTGASYLDLHYLYGLLPKDALWGLIHHGMKNFEMIACAVALGANFIRVGFEDSIYYANDQMAEGNVELVSRVRRFINSMGYEAATAEETREILGIGNAAEKKSDKSS